MRRLESHDQLLKDISTKIGTRDAPPPRAEHSTGSPTNTEQQRHQEQNQIRPAPHRLIRGWPSVQWILHDAGLKRDKSYAMKIECRGDEQLDEQNGTQTVVSTSVARSQGSEGIISGQPDGLRGQDPSDISGNYQFRSPEPYCESDLLEPDLPTITKLRHAYIERIHSKHPFIDEVWLADLFSRLACQFCESDSDQERPRKRQRLTSREMAGSAVFWLVLALGRTCLHEGPLPGPIHESIEKSVNVPGLAYYKTAAGIIGFLADGSDLIHAQLFILAGLYKGSLARPIESQKW